MSRWYRQQVSVLVALGWLSPVAGVRPLVLVDRRDAIRFAIFATMLLTALFYAPALVGGYMADDHFHVFALKEIPQVFTDRLNLFSLVNSTEEVTVYKRWGILPWWTSDAMRINFFRPIPSLTHWLDWQMFGQNPAAAHLVSIGWYVASLYLVYRVLTRFISDGSRTLLLAVAIFALDDTHALNVHWLANRNDVVAAVFLLLSLLSYMRLREGKGAHHAPLSVLTFALALLSKESSVILPVLIVAYAVVFPEDGAESPILGRFTKRLGLHLVLLAMSLVFIAIYFKAGYGANSVYYVHPFKNPALWFAQFLRSGFFHAVILVTGVPLHVLSSSPVRDYPVPAAFLAALTLGFWLVAYKLLKRDRAAGFFVIWMVVAQAILTTSFPDPRLLFLPSIGFAYVVARVMQELWKRRDEVRFSRGMLAALVILHFGFAPILDQMCLHVVNSFQDSYRNLGGSMQAAVDYEALPAAPEGTEVFFLNYHQRESSTLSNLYLYRNLPTGKADSSEELQHAGWTYTEKVDRGFAALKIHYYSLSFLLGDNADVRVVGDREITIAPREGHYFSTLFEQLYTTSSKFKVGQSFALPSFTATIDALNDAGEVTRVRFTFPKPLTSSTYRFMMFDGKRFVPVDVAKAVDGRLAVRAL